MPRDDEPEVSNATLNQALDGVIDSGQALIKIINSLSNMAGKGVLDGKNDLVDLLNKFVDRAQEMKG